MKKRQWLVVSICLAVFSTATACWAAGSDPNSGTPGYVLSVVGDDGWINADSSPEYRFYSDSYSGLADSTHDVWWANAYSAAVDPCYEGGELVYRFEAPSGSLVDAVQLGITGRTYDADHYVDVYANTQHLGRIYSADSSSDYTLGVNAVLDIPSEVVDIKFELHNLSSGAGDPCFTRINGTWLAPGNDYEFAVHVGESTIGEYLLEVDGSGDFYDVGPAYAFEDWCKYKYHVGGIPTFPDVGTTPSTTNTRLVMLIPFQLPEGRLFETCRLDYGSCVLPLHTAEEAKNNWGNVKIDVLTDEGTTVTPIYRHWPPDSEWYYPYNSPPYFRDGFNYDPCGGDPNVAGIDYYRVFTRISDIVAGQKSFGLWIDVSRGNWDVPYGGIFLPVVEEWDTSDFIISGTTTEDPCSGGPELDPTEFRLSASPDVFVPWAKSFGATGTMETFDIGSWFSGPTTHDATASLSVPFQFPRPLVDVRLQYGTTVSAYADQIGYVKLDLQTDEGTTQICLHQSPVVSSPPSMNYTPEGGVPTSGDVYVYTDIDDLVAGKTEFTLNITCRTGWSGHIYNGGLFLPGVSLSGPWDFVVSGHMVDPPTYCGDDYTLYSDSDISGPSNEPDCYVNLYDLAAMANQWLECSDPADPDCVQYWEW